MSPAESAAEIARMDALSRTRALSEQESRYLEALIHKQHLAPRHAAANRRAAEQGQIQPRRRRSSQPDTARIKAALTDPVRLQLLRAIARGLAWARPDAPAGAGPAGTPTSDAAAPARAAASIARPIGPLRSGQSTAIDPGA